MGRHIYFNIAPANDHAEFERRQLESTIEEVDSRRETGVALREWLGKQWPSRLTCVNRKHPDILIALSMDGCQKPASIR